MRLRPAHRVTDDDTCALFVDHRMFSLRHVRQGYVKAKIWIGRGTGAILLLFGLSTLAQLARQL